MKNAALRASTTLALSILSAASASAHTDLIVPDGGEIWQAGSQVTIEWTVVIQHPVLGWDLVYSNSGPQGPWLEIASGLPPGDQAVGSMHTFDWLIPDVPASADVYVKVLMNAHMHVYESQSVQSLTIEAALGSRGCTGQAPNSTGSASKLLLSGSDFVASQDLVLSVIDLPSQEFGFPINSDTLGFSAMPGGAQGNLCLGGTIGRHLEASAVSTASGWVSVSIDLNALPRASAFASAVAGETWHFQWWHRDQVQGLTSNFSDTVSLTLH